MWLKPHLKLAELYLVVTTKHHHSQSQYSVLGLFFLKLFFKCFLVPSHLPSPSSNCELIPAFLSLLISLSIFCSVNSPSIHPSVCVCISLSLSLAFSQLESHVLVYLWAVRSLIKAVSLMGGDTTEWESAGYGWKATKTCNQPSCVVRLDGRACSVSFCMLFLCFGFLPLFPEPALPGLSLPYCPFHVLCSSQ